MCRFYTLLKNKIAFYCSAIFLLTLVLGCAPSYRPYKSDNGFIVLPVDDKTYRIEYFSNAKIVAENFWKTTAVQVCGENYQTVYSETNTILRDLYTPIMGQNVNIGRQKFQHVGEAVCKENTETAVQMSRSSWREYNVKVKALRPVSDAYIVDVLNISWVMFGWIEALPTKNATAAFQKKWNKPIQQETLDGEMITTWEIGENTWFQNQLVFVEKEECLKTIMIVSASLLLMKKQLGNLKLTEDLMQQGHPGIYFYRPTTPCK
jgi:hypothetical protein